MPTVWNVPIRSAPAEPSRSASRSASAARRPLRIRCAWRSTSAPASVGADGRPARAPLQQRHPDDPLERRHLLAQRGLRVAELRRGTREAALAHDRVERREVAELHAQ